MGSIGGIIHFGGKGKTGGGGTEHSGDIHPSLGIPARFLGEGDRPPVDRRHFVFKVILAQTDPIGVERIGLDDVRTRFDIRPVNRGDCFTLGKIQDFGKARGGSSPIGVGGGRQPKTLDHRTHRPVEEQDPVPDFFTNAHQSSPWSIRGRDGRRAFHTGGRKAALRRPR